MSKLSTVHYQAPGAFTEPATGILGAFLPSLPGQRVTATDPASTERQRRYMCADYGRAKRGQKTETGMSRAKLREFCKP